MLSYFIYKILSCLPDLEKFKLYFKAIVLLRIFILNLSKSKKISYKSTIYKGVFIPNKIQLYIADNVKIKSNVIIQGKFLRVEKRVVISNNCFLDCEGEIFIESNSFIGKRVEIYSHHHDYTKKDFDIFQSKEKFMKTKIGKNCIIYNNAIIGPGVTIADDCVIANNSLIITSTDVSSIYVGNPAKKILSKFNPH